VTFNDWWSRYVAENEVSYDTLPTCARAAWDAAVKAERERCLQAALVWPETTSGRDIAERIREGNP
jgi:hypothetical protein